ncbi:MAG TPA: winged helix-turn-helix domain-containing protein [Cytophagales bacterium]|nr:winged helix-turn-helix domain-containing protein [Cytophagales bacterium]
MGLTKVQNFNTTQNKLASYAKALGHPARVAILEFLLKHNSCICNDLVEHLPLSQSTISQHLKELKEAGFIKGEIEGPKICYCINEKVWEEARDMILNIFSAYQANKNCC